LIPKESEKIVGYYFYSGRTSQENKTLYGYSSCTFICSKDFFDKKKHLEERWLTESKDLRLPPHMEELNMGKFYSEFTPDRVRVELLSMGFIEAIHFTVFAIMTDDFR
jgi:hypothetical protein